MTQSAIRRAQAALMIAADAPDADQRPATAIGMSTKEIRDYSLLRALAAKAQTPGDHLGGLEGAAHRAICANLGREPTSLGSFFVPYEIQTRDLTAGVAGAGGYLVDTRQPANTFIDQLRAASRVFQLGATLLPGLVGKHAR